ncbi:MAG: acyl-CoA dehydrogenase family protein [Candidatus Dormibacteraeota bacterium]|nr:acyl-CoA dehydrogenase family protein [Candidatus Dormibacteraeota bacterium]
MEAPATLYNEGALPPLTDFYRVDDLLNEEERLVRSTIGRFVDQRFLPVVAEHYERGTFPADLVPELAKLGVFGMHLHGYGAAGLSNVMYGLACQELERGDSGLRSFVSVQGSLCMFPINRYGSEEQKARWLPGMAKGEVIGCFGLTEPEFGSNPAGMASRARRDGSDWVLNGTKRWITNGNVADLAIVWARTDEGIRGFLVEKGTKGFEARQIHHKLSMRASVTSELILDDCRIPAANELPGARGLKGPLSCLNEARFGIVWGVLGAAIACYQSALDYAKARVQFDKPIAGYQLTQEKLVNMLTEITKGQLLALQLGRLKDEGKATATQISMAKLNNVREALTIARDARSILGGNGISLEYPVMRHMANLETVLTYEGTSEIHMLAVGEEITGIPAFK